MSCYSFMKLFYPVLIRSALAGWCGAIKPELRTVPEGTNVTFRLTRAQNLPNQPNIRWRYEIPGNFSILCNSIEEQCVEPTKYTLSENGHVLTIKTVSQNDSGNYISICSLSTTHTEWSERGQLNVTRVTTSASNERESHLETISTKSTKEYRSPTQSATTSVEIKTVKIEVIAKTSGSNGRQLHLTESTNEYFSTTHGATATEESKTMKTQVIGSVTDNKVSSALEDTSQVTTIVVAGLVAVGVMLTVIVVVIICKKQKKDEIHRGSQKSGPTHINSEVSDGDCHSLPNDSGQPHSCQRSEGMSSAVQHEAVNPGALYDQHASSSAGGLINSEYATVVPKKDRISSTWQKETHKVAVKEEERAPEYATVVKSRQPGCSVEQATQGSNDKNERGMVYADLDLVSRPQRQAASKEYEATEYVSIDFRKTATLKSQEK